MPCYDGGPPSHEETRNDALRKFMHETGLKLPADSMGWVQQNDIMARQLCRFFKPLKGKGADPTKYSLELQIWWRDHQREDDRREKEEIAKAERRQLRKQALAKLTPAERAALGVRRTGAEEE